MRRQSLIFAMLLGIAATMAGSNAFAATGTTTVPGSACTLVTPNTWATVAGVTYAGMYMKNQSTSTLWAVCPITLESSLTYTQATVWASGINDFGCYLYYPQSKQVYRWLGPLKPGFDGISVPFTIPGTISPGLSTATVVCSVGSQATVNQIEIAHN